MIAPQAEILDQREITVFSYETTLRSISTSFRHISRMRGSLPRSLLGVFQRRSRWRDAIEVVLGLLGTRPCSATTTPSADPSTTHGRGDFSKRWQFVYERTTRAHPLHRPLAAALASPTRSLRTFNEALSGSRGMLSGNSSSTSTGFVTSAFGRFLERLYLIRFSNPSALAYESIDHALFQSRKYMILTSGGLREIRRDRQATSSPSTPTSPS